MALEAQGIDSVALYDIMPDEPVVSTEVWHVAGRLVCCTFFGDNHQSDEDKGH